MESDIPIIDYDAVYHGFRLLSKHYIDKPKYPEIVPGCLALNAARIDEYIRQRVEYAICRAERLQYGQMK